MGPARVEKHDFPSGGYDVLVGLDGHAVLLLLPTQHDEAVILLLEKRERLQLLHFNLPPS